MPTFGNINTTETALNTIFGDHGADHGATGVDPLPNFPHVEHFHHNSLYAIPNASPFYAPFNSTPFSAARGGIALSFSTASGGGSYPDSKVTLPAGYGGIWCVQFQAFIQGAGGQHRNVSILYNTTTSTDYPRVYRMQNRPSPSPFETAIHVTMVRKMAAGDYCVFQIYQDHGVAVNGQWRMRWTRLGG